jgi:flagellar biosynthetic protein FlhB
MAEGDKESRTHAPTPRRRQQARERGQVPRSREIDTVAVLLAGLAVGLWVVPALLARYGGQLRGWIALAGSVEVTPGTVPLLFRRAAAEVVTLAWPLLATAIVAGVAAQVSQGGVVLRAERLAPDLSRLDPLAGFRRLVSAHGLVTLVKAALKLFVIGGVAAAVVLRAEDGVEALVTMPLPDILAFLGAGVRATVGWVVLALLVVAALDYGWEYYRSEQRLRMTRQEVDDDLRASEGDVKIKRRFRKFHYELTKNRMLAEVPNADVVLTNPVHVAVALRYVADLMRAPIVIAKGADEVAEQIKTIARGAGVPIVERRALARALFRSVKIGQEVPVALYRAVAEVLAYIYSLGRSRPAAGGVAG